MTYSLTVPTGYHATSLNASGCKVYYVKRTLIDLGVILLESPHGNQIRVTGLERTMVDLFRNRNRLDIQMFHDALKRYVGKKDRNLDVLYTYARKFRVQQIARQTLEVLLWAMQRSGRPGSKIWLPNILSLLRPCCKNPCWNACWNESRCRSSGIRSFSRGECSLLQWFGSATEPTS